MLYGMLCDIVWVMGGGHVIDMLYEMGNGSCFRMLLGSMSNAGRGEGHICYG